MKTWTAVWQEFSVDASKVDLFLLSTGIKFLSLPFCHGPRFSPQEGLGVGRRGLAWDWRGMCETLLEAEFAQKAHFSLDCRAY